MQCDLVICAHFSHVFPSELNGGGGVGGDLGSFMDSRVVRVNPVPLRARARARSDLKQQTQATQLP